LNLCLAIVERNLNVLEKLQKEEEQFSVNQIREKWLQSKKDFKFDFKEDKEQIKVLQRLQLSSILDAQVFNEILQLFENPELTFGRCKERMSVVYDLLFHSSRQAHLFEKEGNFEQKLSETVLVPRGRRICQFLQDKYPRPYRLASRKQNANRATTMVRMETFHFGSKADFSQQQEFQGTLLEHLVLCTI